MDLTQLANLGEFIGGVAVLVTLIYLTAQVRQSAHAQRRANELAQADAVHKSTTSFGAFRKMLSDEGTNSIWLKARNDNDLTPEEEQRVFYLLQELTFSALTAMTLQRAAGNMDETADAIPAAIAGQMRQSPTVQRVSQTLHRIWLPVGEDLTAAGFGDFAASIARRLESFGGHA